MTIQKNKKDKKAGLHPTKGPLDLDTVLATVESGEEAALCWYLVQIEQWAERSLEEDLRSLGYESYLPREKFWGQRRRGCRVAMTKPLFGGYMFVAVDYPRQDFATVSGVLGIGAFLGMMLLSDGTPGPRALRPRYVEGLRRAEALGFFDRACEPDPLAVDQVVKIVGGQFMGYIGRVIRAKAGEKRVRILFEMFQRMTELDIEAAKLEVQPQRPDAA